ncbi:MAG: T9SS type A sorting domain-containing protein [Flavobacteriales bacterium]|nr:T9SS type A sorting domain-containing protein [Flavobacteriales bacterium]
MFVRIFLLVVLSLVLKQEVTAQTWTLINSTSFTTTQYRNIPWDSIYAGVDYKLEMKGTWTGGNSSTIDTRYRYDGSVVDYGFNFFVAGPKYVRTMAPTPHAYNASTHTYDVFFTGADTLVWFKYSDTYYPDNGGTVYFKLYADCSFPSFEAPDGVTICYNATTDLTATGGLKYRWYNVSTGGSPIATTATFTTPALTTTTTYYVTSYYEAGCESDRQAVTVTVENCPNEWIGTTSSDWDDATNWSFATVPTALDDVEIASGAPFQPHVTLATPTPAICNALSILSGATLTVDAGKALTVSGATSNAGTILVKADATGIGSFIDNGTITGAGSFQMEQYLTGAGATGAPTGVFYYVGSPVVGATAANYDIANGNKIWSASEVGQNYPQITNDATVLNPTQGYVARMGATGSITLDGSSFNTGSQSAAGLTRTGNTEANRGYNLVSNPYPSSVNWDDAVKSNVGTTIWYRTHTLGNVMTYDTYNESVPGVGTSNNFTGNDVAGIIAPGQAFWVRVIADETSNGSVSFTNAMRSHGTLTSIYKQEAEEGIVRFNLSNGTVSDETILHFNTEALDDFDAYDSEKMWASNIPQLYTTTGADSLTINGLYSTATNPIVDLGVKLPSSGDYTLNATSITITNESVYLEDRMLNIFQDLNVEPNYAFTSVAGNIGDRFALHFGMTAVGIGRDAINRVSTRVYTSNGNTLNIILSENTENGKVDVLDMAGRIVGSFNLSTNITSVNMNVSIGVYHVRVETENGMDTHRVLLN